MNLSTRQKKLYASCLNAQKDAIRKRLVEIKKYKHLSYEFYLKNKKCGFVFYAKDVDNSETKYKNLSVAINKLVDSVEELKRHRQLGGCWMYRFSNDVILDLTK